MFVIYSQIIRQSRTKRTLSALSKSRCRKLCNRPKMMSRTVKALSKKVIWTPQPKQKIALSRGEDEGLYGGAAGGGKTDYLVVEAARQVNIPEYRGLILRRAVPDLARIIDQTRAIYPSIDRGQGTTQQQECGLFRATHKLSSALYFARMKNISTKANSMILSASTN